MQFDGKVGSIKYYNLAYQDVLVRFDRLRRLCRRCISLLGGGGRCSFVGFALSTAQKPQHFVRLDSSRRPSNHIRSTWSLLVSPENKTDPLQHLTTTTTRNDLRESWDRSNVTTASQTSTHTPTGAAQAGANLLARRLFLTRRSGILLTPAAVALPTRPPFTFGAFN